MKNLTVFITLSFLSIACSESAQIEGACDGAESHVDELEIENAQLRARIAETEKDLQKAWDEADGLQEENESSVETVESLNARIADLESIVVGVRSESFRYQQMLYAEQEEYRALVDLYNEVSDSCKERIESCGGI